MIRVTMTRGRYLRALREHKGMTLERVAEAAQVSAMYLWKLEMDSGSDLAPSAGLLLRLATVLDTTIGNIESPPAITVVIDSETSPG